VRRLVAAINGGDRDAFLATLTPDATLTDDGNPRSLTDWIDREIFSAHGHMTIEREEEHGLHLLARYRNDTWARPEPTTNWQGHASTSPEKQKQPTLALGGAAPTSTNHWALSRIQIWLIGTQFPPEASNAGRLQTRRYGRARGTSLITISNWGWSTPARE
jgi:hypothetical protein